MINTLPKPITAPAAEQRGLKALTLLMPPDDPALASVIRDLERARTPWALVGGKNNPTVAIWSKPKPFRPNDINKAPVARTL